MKQKIFNFFEQEHNLTLLDGQMQDIIHLIKEHIQFDELISDAFDEGVEDEYNVHINCVERRYKNGKDYYEKTFKRI